MENASTALPIDLGGGLLLRRSRPADRDALAEFNSIIHANPGDPPRPDEMVGEWTADLLSGSHPTFGTGDFTIVEETASGRIVSASNLISQTWSYAGISFGVGRPELVGTHPDYRNRGLVRRQFEVLHGWSKERGHLVQAITGIPYYYRLYGYEMCVNLGVGRLVYETQIRQLKEGEQEPYLIRPASEADIPDLAACYARLEQRSPLACRRGEAEWRYELRGKSANNVTRVELYMICEPQGGVVGALGVPVNFWGLSWVATFYELKAGVSYLAVTPAVLRFLHALGRQRGTAEKPYQRTGLFLGEEHPAYLALEPQNAPPNRPYAWYLRVPDLAEFLRRIAPVLEQRLADSPCAGHSGGLRISFYNRGLELQFEGGKIRQVRELESPGWEDADARFPGQTFLQILFQHRSYEELRHIYPDAFANTTAAALLKSMFPRQPSEIWPLS
jgi:hypothetical protein